MRDEFEEAAKQPRVHSFKNFLETVYEEAGESVDEYRGMIADEVEWGHDPASDTYMPAVLHGRIFTQEVFRKLISQYLKRITFLSNEQVQEKFPQLEGKDIDEIDLVHEGFELAEDEYPDHIKYYRYIEDDFFKELDQNAQETNRQLEYILTANPPLKDGHIRDFKDGIESEAEGIYNTVGISYETGNPEFYEGFDHIAVGLEDTTSHFEFYLSEARKKMAKAVNQQTEDTDHIAAKIAFNAAMIETINQLRTTVEYIPDNQISDFLPEMTEDDFSALSDKELVEKLLLQNKCPLDPRFMGGVISVLIDQTEELFENKDFISKHLEKIKEEFGFDVDPVGFRGGISLAVEQASERENAPKEIMDKVAAEKEEEMPSLQKMLGVLHEDIRQYRRISKREIHKILEQKETQEALSIIAGRLAYTRELKNVFREYMKNMRFLSIDELATYFPDTKKEDLDSIDWEDIKPLLESDCIPDNNLYFQEVKDALVVAARAKFDSEDDKFDAFNEFYGKPPFDKISIKGFDLGVFVAQTRFDTKDYFKLEQEKQDYKSAHDLLNKIMDKKEQKKSSLPEVETIDDLKARVTESINDRIEELDELRELDVPNVKQFSQVLGHLFGLKAYLDVLSKYLEDSADIEEETEGALKEAQLPDNTNPRVVIENTIDPFCDKVEGVSYISKNIREILGSLGFPKNTPVDKDVFEKGVDKSLEFLESLMPAKDKKPRPDDDIDFKLGNYPGPGLN